MATLLKLYKRILRDWPHIVTMWASAEIVIKFHQVAIPDYQGFVIAIAGIVGVLTGKHYWDTKADKIEQQEGK